MDYLRSRMEEGLSQTEMRPIDEATSGQTVLDCFIIFMKSSGITTAIIGCSGMVANLLLSEKKGMTIWRAIGHTFAAGIVGWLSGKALGALDISDGARVACVGISGAFAVEIKDACLRLIRFYVRNWMGRNP